jgi:hypothetical protein
MTYSFKDVEEIERCVVAGIMRTHQVISSLRFDEYNLLSEEEFCRNFGFNNGDIADFAAELGIKEWEIELAEKWYNGNNDFVWKH